MSNDRRPEADEDEDMQSGLVLRHISDGRRGYAFGSVEVFERDARIKRGVPWRETKGGGLRGPILGLSRQSRRRLMHYARNLPRLSHMLTLTYPACFPNDGRRVKRDWAVLRKWVVAKFDVGGLWFLEFQKRGAPHLHVFCNRFLPKEEVSLRWYEIVGSEDEKHLHAGTRIEYLRKPNAVSSYAAKYATKMEQKEVPLEFRSVGRMWGHFNIKIESQVFEGRREQVSPLVRQIRRMRDSKRRRLGLPKLRDSGTLGFVAYDVGPATRQLLDWVNSMED